MRRLLALACAAIVAALAACDDHAQHRPMMVADGDPGRGKQAIQSYGCGACHTIPGIAGANANVGPPLTAAARQPYVAGILPNTPDQLVRWIVDPPAVDPRTAMPDLQVTEADARDIAAYLYKVGR